MEVSGQHWAPDGPIQAGSEEWKDAIQWAISEADRLGMAFTLTVDFGYGSGGPHITPDNSMQKLVWSAAEIEGGVPVDVPLSKPTVDTEPKDVWLRPGLEMRPDVVRSLKEIDSYRDVSVFALPTAQLAESRMFPSGEETSLAIHDGRGSKTSIPPLSGAEKLSALPADQVIDLTDKMTADGQLRWEAPPGDWTVIRLGHATNLKMTRPCPAAEVGLECDRLSPRGIDSHFDHRLKPILDAAGKMAGRTLRYIHVDSWEARGQNWTSTFAEEFKKRRGYEIQPWLPVLTGHAVRSVEQTERFLWDMRQTVSEVTLANYIDRLRERIAPYGVGFSSEAYGDLCVNNLDYASRSDLPIAEFWTETSDPEPFPKFSRFLYNTMKGMASAANTYGKPRVGAEAFTGSRGWIDHPYLLKAMGDEAFCNGINHFIFHLSAHQAYETMKPGLTHRRWGQHFHRHQTWWDYSMPYFDYIARCQSLLQQGRTVTDIAVMPREGAPVNFMNDDQAFDGPKGFDYDFCGAEIVGMMQYKDGRIYLPSGANYRYLLLPADGRLTRETAEKIDALHQAGATVLKQSEIIGTPGLAGYPQADEAVKTMASKWPLLDKNAWQELLDRDQLKPDFIGDDLRWIHRRSGTDDIYFVSNPTQEPIERRCTFRISGKVVELWDPQTGRIFAAPGARHDGEHTSLDLAFGPSQSWFVVFRNQPSASALDTHPFPSWKTVQEIKGNWQLDFDPQWGTDKTLTTDALRSWSESDDPKVKYYSGTGTYRTSFSFVGSEDIKTDRFLLDLGQVEVIARVTLNGHPCGIAWKPPYRVDITEALRQGMNALTIEVANTWVNRMIGDEQFPLDSSWENWETLSEWPDWFGGEQERTSDRYTFTSVRFYNQDSAPMPSGLLGPVNIHKESSTLNK